MFATKQNNENVILARGEGSSHLLLRGVVVDRRISLLIQITVKMSEIKN
jgi:hypothetical protein